MTEGQAPDLMTEDAARILLRHAASRFTLDQQQSFDRRNRDILTAATVLPQKEVAELAGLSAETIRKITKGHPVSWERRVTTRKLGTDG